MGFAACSGGSRREGNSSGGESGVAGDAGSGAGGAPVGGGSAQGGGGGGAGAGNGGGAGATGGRAGSGGSGRGGSAPSGGVAGGSGGASGEAGAGNEGGQGACNDIANGAGVIEAVRIDVDPPAPMGGAIADGTYYLLSRIIYAGVGGPSGGRTEMHRATMIIAGSEAQFFGGDVSDVAERRSLSFGVNGTNLTIDTTCPGGIPEEIHPFTATGPPVATILSIYYAEGSETRIESWRKP